MAERFDRQFPGRRMAAILFERGRPSAKRGGPKTEKSRAGKPAPRPAVRGATVINWAEFAALSNPRGRGFLIGGGDMGGRSARVAGFCLTKTEKNMQRIVGGRLFHTSRPRDCIATGRVQRSCMK